MFGIIFKVVSVLELIAREEKLFTLCLCFLLFLMFFLVSTTIRNHLLLREVIAWNKKNGIIMDFEFGWLGVRILSKTVKTNTEKTQIDMNGRCLWNLFFSVSRGNNHNVTPLNIVGGVPFGGREGNEGPTERSAGRASVIAREARAERSEFVKR